MKQVKLTVLLGVVALGSALIFLRVTKTYGQSAQVTRTWVSSFGSDSNPCSRTAPCKTFVGALAQTLPGGEIDVLDPGSYGPVDISQAVTIDGGRDQIASIMVSSGNGIVVQAGANDNVTLRHLQINGIASGANGIRFLSGKSLRIENCTVFGFSNNGIDIASAGGAVIVEGTRSHNNGNSGINVNSTARTTVAIDHSHFDENWWGINAQNFSVVTASHSTANGNSNTGFISDATSGNATLNLMKCVAANNVGGIQAGLSGAPGTTNVSGCMVSGNLIAGFSIVAGSTLKSWGNNFNTGSGTPQAPNLAPE